MNKNQLRIEQYETVLFNANLNPLGIPKTVRRSLEQNIDSIIKYPDAYYNNLKKSVAAYAGVTTDEVIMGNGSVDLLKLFSALVQPRKVLVLSPGPSDHSIISKAYGAEIVYYDLKEEDDFVLNVPEFIDSLSDDIDLLYISNPNNPTSRKLTRSSVLAIAERCRELDIFFIIDEMYIEFLDNYLDYTAVPLIKSYENMAVIRSVSKFFAVPGLRFAYAVMNNPDLMLIIDLTTTKNNVASLTAIAITNMFKDTDYIEESSSIVHTERSLVYLAMSTSTSIKLYKPDANFMLIRLLNPEVTSGTVAEHCNLRGIIIRKCDDIRGLGNDYIRVCFMNPKQNDLMVNTILEIM